MCQFLVFKQVKIMKIASKLKYFVVCLSMSDRSAEDPARSCSDFQSQDGLHQHPGRRAAGGDAVSDEVPLKGSSSVPECS